MSMLKAKISAALAKIGTTNGTAPRESQDPLDKVAHEYNVATTIASIADKRKDNAKKDLIAALSQASANTLAKTKDNVAATNLSDTVDLGAGANHTVSAQVKIGASFLDTDALRVALKRKMPSDEVDKLFDDCTKRRAPSVTFIVAEYEDE